jgi:hypothetical protein
MHRFCVIAMGVCAAIDGPGSLLNFQGHPVERLTPARGVTYPNTAAGLVVPEILVSETAFGLRQAWPTAIRRRPFTADS